MFTSRSVATVVTFIGAVFSLSVHAQEDLVGAVSGELDISNGVASYSVPIDVVPGRGGMQPSLSLAYSSAGGGNGLVGMGWQLQGLSSIHRCTATYAQDGFKGRVNFDEQDRYCFNGQRLIAVDGANGAVGTEYRTEVDSYSRIRSIGGSANNPNTFVMETKAGQVMTFGGDDATLSIDGNVTTWSLREVNDTTGNNPVTYRYSIDQNAQYLNEIAYTGGRVVINYEDRDDISRSYFKGSPVVIDQRVTSIETYSASAMIKRYQLNYLAFDTDNPQIQQYSKINAITVCDSSGRCVPPVAFEWADPGEVGNVTNEWVTSDGNWGSIEGTWVADFNGDGRSDIASRSGNTMTMRLSTGSGFDEQEWSVDGRWGDDEWTWLADFNGDGLPDIASRHGSQIHMRLSTGSGFDLQVWDVPERWGDNNKYIQVADFNGDGLADIASPSYGAVFMWLSTGSSFDYQVWDAGDNQWSDQLWTADFNADGLMDIATRDGDRVNMRLSTGSGFAHQTWGSSDGRWGRSRHTFVGDFNGDGLPDIASADTDRTFMRFSTGTGFNYEVWDSPGYWGHSDGVTYAGDFNGDGVSDAVSTGASVLYVRTSTRVGFILEEQGYGGLALSNYYGGRYLGYNWLGDFDGNGRPEIAVRKRSAIEINSTVRQDLPLIESITGSTGTVTELEYKPLTDNTVYTKGSGASFPVIDAQGTQHVVSAMRADNGAGGTSSVLYHYTGLKAHAQGRGSFGYDTITETYPDTNKTITAYHDQSEFPLAGKVVRVVERLGDTVINRSATDYAFTVSDDGVYQVTMPRSVQASYELGDDTTPITTVTTTHSNIDTFGNIGRVTVVTKGGGETFNKITNSTYTNDTNSWYLGRLTQTTTTHRSPYGEDERRRVRFGYDASTGLLNREEVMSLATGLPLTTKTYRHDDYGHVVSTTLAAEGETDRTATTTYNNLGQAVRSCNLLNQCASTEYNARGLPVRVTDANDITTEFTYDSFDRKIGERLPDGTESQTLGYYASSGRCGELAGGAYSCSVSQSTGSAPVITQIDALGRTIRTIKTGFDGRAIYSDTEYNRLGQVTRVSRDYFEGDHIYWATSEYDALDRVIRATEPGPHGSTNEIITQYNGLSTTISTGPDALAKTTMTNAIGQTIRIEEETGTYTEYTYNSEGNILTTRVAGDDSTLITLSYDEFGRKIVMDDPDMGQWSYAYDAFSQLVRQTDAKGQVVTMEYDRLGRITRRVEPEGVSTLSYYGNSAPKGSIGKLHQERGNGMTKTHAYDQWGRPTTTATAIAGEGNFTTRLSYDSLSRVSRTTYPGTQGFYTENIYNEHGYLERVRGLRSQAEQHDYSQLQPLIAEATTLADSYLNKANELRDLGLYYQTRIDEYTRLLEQSATTATLSVSSTVLQTHENLLSTTVDQGQAQGLKVTQAKAIPVVLPNGMLLFIGQKRYSMVLDATLLSHISNTVIELTTVQSLLSDTSTRYAEQAAQLTVLAEQTLAAADHNFQFVRTLDNSAEAYEDLLADDQYMTYWRAVDVDSSGRISAEVYGNGIVNDYAYNQGNGHLQSINSSLLVLDPVRHLEYQYDAYGNVTLRDDLVNDIRETFDYDRLDRLTATHVSSDLYDVPDFNNTQSVSYDMLGNITQKSDVGSYRYGNQAGPHAVTQAGGNTYRYDANGNMTRGAGRTIQWSSFNKPTQITRNGQSARFDYGPDRARFRKVNHKGDTTLYVGKLYERLETTAGRTDQKHYVYAAGQLIAEHIVSNREGTQTRYLHKDALGSVDLVTDTFGNVVDRRSFDAWGKLRNLPWQSQAGLNDPLYLTQLPFTNKGYTGHESVQEVELIHMNGRMYDATLARFISPDPHIQAGSNTQSYNRYSYVINNPMKYNDPSGYFFKSLFKAIGKALGSIASVAHSMVGVVVSTSLASMGCIVCGPGLLSGIINGAVVGAISGAAAGLATGGDFLQGALIGGFTGGISFGIGQSGLGLGGKALAHGIVGGTMNVIRGGKFGTGFISSAFTKFVSPAIQGLSNAAGAARDVVGIAGAALVGGTASVLGGGKFANGASTAALQYAFNQISKHKSLPNLKGRQEAAMNEVRALYVDGTLGRGRVFPTADDAAVEVLSVLTPIGTKYTLEFGGFIMKVNGGYTYSGITPGDENGAGGMGSVPSGAVAGFHTHPDYAEYVTNFSIGDTDWVKNTQTPLYLGARGLVKSCELGSWSCNGDVARRTGLSYGGTSREHNRLLGGRLVSPR